MAASVKAACDPRPFSTFSHCRNHHEHRPQELLLPIARAVSATLFFVLSVAFVSVPYSLEQDPSDAQQRRTPQPRAT